MAVYKIQKGNVVIFIIQENDYFGYFQTGRAPQKRNQPWSLYQINITSHPTR